MRKIAIALALIASSVALAEAVAGLVINTREPSIGANCAANGSTAVAAPALVKGRKYIVQAFDETACFCFGTASCAASTGLCVSPGQAWNIQATDTAATCRSAGVTGDIWFTPSK